jgi:hypothetical protein
VKVRRILVASVGTAALVAMGSGPALGGEITGSGKPTPAPANTNSICAFSGLNDSPSDPFPEGGRVQSYGQIVRLGLKSVAPSPGVGCNGHSGFLAGGGEE